MGVLACILVSMAVAFLMALAGCRAKDGIDWSSSGVKCFLRNCLMCGTPLGVLVFCCWFFWYAFETTRCKINQEVPTITFHCPSASQRNDIERIVFGDEFQGKVEKMLTSREAIVKTEHDNFRAELGTWLSIFGLLSILATIVFSAASYVMQHLSLREERDDIQKEFNEVKSKNESMAKNFVALTQEYEKLKKEFEVISKAMSSKADNAAASIDASIDAAAKMADIGAGTQEDQEAMTEIRSALRRFQNEWPSLQSRQNDSRGAFEEKIRHGIEILKRINGRLLCVQNAEVIRGYLNLLNSVNIYLGNVTDEEFKQWFFDAMRLEQPLTIDETVISAKLAGVDSKVSQICLGYYGTLRNRQYGIR